MIPLIILTIEDEDDRSFMTEVYVRYERLIYSEIYKLMNDRWLVEDVMQTTLMKLIDQLARLRGMDERHRINYIITAARNNAISALRTHGNRASASLEAQREAGWDLGSDFSVEETILRGEKIGRLKDIWPELDARSRYLLESKYILDASSKEMAQTLGIKEDSVRVELSRARRKARQLLSKLDGDEET